MFNISKNNKTYIFVNIMLHKMYLSLVRVKSTSAQFPTPCWGETAVPTPCKYLSRPFSDRNTMRVNAKTIANLKKKYSAIIGKYKPLMYFKTIRCFSQSLSIIIYAIKSVCLLILRKMYAITACCWMVYCIYCIRQEFSVYSNELRGAMFKQKFTSSIFTKSRFFYKRTLFYTLHIFT